MEEGHTIWADHPIKDMEHHWTTKEKMLLYPTRLWRRSFAPIVTAAALSGLLLGAPPAYAATRLNSSVTSMASAHPLRTTMATPNLICKVGGDCGTWQSFAPGTYCLSIYPSDPGGSCTEIDWGVTYQGGSSLGPVSGCIVGLVLASASTWIPVGGEVTWQGALWACGSGTLSTYL